MPNNWGLYSCSVCGREIEEDDGHTIGGFLVCGDCAVELAEKEKIKPNQ